MNTPEIILSVLVLLFTAIIIFNNAVKNISGLKKTSQWILLSTGFIAYFALLFSLFVFVINGFISKGIIPILSVSLFFILPLTAITAFAGINRVKSTIRNLVK